MGGIQPWHIVLVVVVFVLLFGGRKLPDAARGLGRSLRILKSEVGAMHDEDAKSKAIQAAEPTIAPQPPAPVRAASATEPVVQVPGAELHPA